MASEVTAATGGDRRSMDRSTTYRKTAKGSEAVATRDRALQPRLRSLLILVDGKRSVDELARMTPAGFEDSLDQLVQLGLVEPAEGAPAGEKAGTTQPAPLAAEPAPAATVSLAEAQRYAVRRLSDMLGPASDDICLRIERTRNAGEFKAVLLKAEQLIDASLGAARAQEFAQEMQSHWPA